LSRPKTFKSALTLRLPPFPFLPPPRRPRRKNIFKDFLPEDNGSVAQTVHLAFKALSDRIIDRPDEVSVEGPQKMYSLLY
jgi:hypothetical protein